MIFLKSMLRTCMTFVLTIVAIIWGWGGILHFFSIDPMLGIFATYALLLTPIIAVFIDPPTRWEKPLGVALLSRSIGSFLGGCIPSIVFLISIRNLSEFAEFAPGIVGLTVGYVVVCVVIIWF